MSTPDAPENRSSLIGEMAAAIGIDPALYWKALKGAAGCGKDKDGREIATDAEFLVLLYFAKTYKLDPLAREVGLIAGKGGKGARPYVEFNGWLRVLVSHPDYKAHGVRYTWADEKKKDLVSVTCWIARKSMEGTEYEVAEHPEFMAECRNTESSYSAWNKWPVRMLAEKAIMQATRFIFGMFIPDREDVEAAMNAEAGRAEERDVAATPIAPAAPIPGAKKSRKKPDAPSAEEAKQLPPPDVAGQTTIDDFLRGKSEPVPVVTAGDSGFTKTSSTSGRLPTVQYEDARPVAAPMAEQLAQAVADLPKPTDPATLPAFDPAESLRVDRALADASREDFDDILS